ncbi:protein-export chaperone SecB [Roseovarius dicentrarchi]|uniref:protein-export chaperone SecB n=1 Tax=Roseovarius dicentrarchi TaxID=2250573 RepID=UPI000DE8A9AB|nr:protein-export chaperone SecB [Roseovarius dicentrarchi]
MAEQENGAEGAQNDQPQQQPQVKMNTLTQFVRDLSFENILAQRGTGGEVQPDITVNVHLEPKKRSTENQYEVIAKLKINSKNKGTDEDLFVLELEYAGVFHIEGVPEDQLHPFLMIECPRMMFPFFRRIVSDVTRDGGFPPLNLENIDFVSIYRQEIARIQAQKGQRADA